MKTLSTLALELSRQTTQFRDRLISKNLEENAKVNSHFKDLFSELQPMIPQNSELKDFADLYALTLTAFFLNAAFLSEEKEKWSHIEASIQNWFQFNKSIKLGQGTIAAYKIISSIAGQRLPIEMKNLILLITGKIYTSSQHNNDRGNPNQYFQILPFMEIFMASYNTQMKENYGVFFTPYPAVSFILRLINEVLKEKMNKTEGISDSGVTLIDPAAGTSTFKITAAIQTTKEISKTTERGKEFYVLKNFCGIETLLPLYILSYLNIVHLSKNLNLKLTQNDHYNLFWSNSLLEPEKTGTCPVILGNPPYAIFSRDGEEWITESMKEYIPGDEKNTKWLNADCVKFFRAAQVKIDHKEEGIICFVTNNSYLDSPTFKMMRHSLLKSFDEIYILNLHGNAMNKGKCPKGLKDENIFDIRQGVAISMLIKKKIRNKTCKVYYTDLWGSREEKLNFLDSQSVKTVPWKEIKPEPDFYPFSASAIKSRTFSAKTINYNKYIRITDIFPVNSVGIVTARDRLTIHNSPDQVLDAVTKFSSLPENEARSVFGLGNDTRDWSVKLAQEDIRKSELKKDFIVPILYRPFDVRYTYFTGKTKGFLCMPRQNVMKHMLIDDNICLVTVRQVAEGKFNHCFVSNTIVDGRATRSNRGICYTFPLYLSKHTIRRKNISKEFKARLAKSMDNKIPPTVRQIFFYTYAILSSNIYRTLYREFLEQDFPKIPMPLNSAFFVEMAKIGERLAYTHLISQVRPKTHFASFEGEVVKNVRYKKISPDTGSVHINKTSQFAHLPPDLWNLEICGYRVLENLLKNIIGQKITYSDIEWFSQVSCALALTVDYQRKIDKIIRSSQIMT